MKATVWLTTLLLMASVVVLALWTSRDDGDPSPEALFPVSVEEEREPVRAGVASDPSTIRATSRVAAPETPVAIAAKAQPSAAAESLPAEAMLHVGDVLNFQCAMQMMVDERFPDAIRALSDDAESEPAAMDMRAAIAEAYREAFALAGGGAEVAALACGLRICIIEAHLPSDTTEDEIRAAFVSRLLGDLGRPAVSIELPAQDSGPRIMRRVFSVSPDVTRTDRVATSCTLPEQEQGSTSRR